MAKGKSSQNKSKEEKKVVRRSSGTNVSDSIPTAKGVQLIGNESLEEFRSIFLPGLPWNVSHVPWNSTLLLSYLPTIRKPYEAFLIVLLLLVVLLIAILAVCLVRYCEKKRAIPSGYSQPPHPPPDEGYEDHNDVIAEVVNRREQSPYIKNKRRLSNSDSAIPSRAAPDETQSYHGNSGQRVNGSDETTENQWPNPVRPAESAEHYLKLSRSPPMLTQIEAVSEQFQSTGKGQEHLFSGTSAVTSEPFEFSLSSAKQSGKSDHQLPITIPSRIARKSKSEIHVREASSIKLIPIENLVMPRSFSDPIRRAYPADPVRKPSVEQVLFMSPMEKSRSRGAVLEPDRVASTPKTSMTVVSDTPPPAKSSSSDKLSLNVVDDLTEEQWKEEKLKFFRACWKNEMKRRQSLCHISYSGSLVDPDLYNEAFQAAKLQAAKLTKSAPLLNYAAFGRKFGASFNYSTDYLAESPIWSDHRFQVLNATTESSDPFSGSISSSYEDVQSANKTFSGETRYTTHETERSRHNPSNTSVWSTVASESVIEEDKRSDFMEFEEDKLSDLLEFEEISQNEYQEEWDATQVDQAVHVHANEGQLINPLDSNVSPRDPQVMKQRTESYITPSHHYGQAPTNVYRDTESLNTDADNRVHRQSLLIPVKTAQPKISVAEQFKLNLQDLAKKGGVSLPLESDQIPSSAFLGIDHLKDDSDISATSISQVFEGGDVKTFQTLFQKDQAKVQGIMKEFEPLMVSAGLKKHGNVQTQRLSTKDSTSYWDTKL